MTFMGVSVQLPAPDIKVLSKMATSWTQVVLNWIPVHERGLTA